jgi:hypothetical protein
MNLPPIRVMAYPTAMDIYEGHVNSAGLPHGMGVCHYRDGWDEGEWVEGKLHGKGIMVFGNGQRYEGDFVKSLREGFGIYYLENGEKYVGQWKNNKRSGKGEVFDEKGKLICKGQYLNGLLVPFISSYSRTPTFSLPPSPSFFFLSFFFFLSPIILFSFLRDFFARKGGEDVLGRQLLRGGLGGGHA